MAALISISLAVVLAFLSGLHFYWGLGGKWGFEAALPTKTSGEKLISPSGFASFLVALLLGFSALLCFVRGGWADVWLPRVFEKFGLIAVGVVFLLRAVGKFRYVGFFKKIKTTTFGVMDTRFYSPLCLALALLLFLLEFYA